jgi:hypothetical protein
LELYLSGQGQLWLYILKNLPATVYLAQRKFDVVVCHPPGTARSAIPELLPEGTPAPLGADAAPDLPNLINIISHRFLNSGGRLGLLLPREAGAAAGIEALLQPADGESGATTLGLECLADFSSVAGLSEPTDPGLAAVYGPGSDPPDKVTHFRGNAPENTATWREALENLQSEQRPYSGW